MRGVGMRGLLRESSTRATRSWAGFQVERAPALLLVGVFFGLIAALLAPSGLGPTSLPAWHILPVALQYALLLPGTLLLVPHDRLPASRLRILLDALLLLTVVGAGAWYFLVGPAILAPHAGPTDALVSVCDAALLLAGLLAVAHARGTALFRSSVLVGMGVVLVVVSDTVKSYEAQQVVRMVPGLAGLWPVGAGLILVGSIGAVRMGRNRAREPVRWEDIEPPSTYIPTLAGVVLPYLLLPAMALLVSRAIQVPQQTALAGGVYGAAALLLLLLFARQMVSAMEHRHLYQEVVSYAQNVHRLNRELRAAQSELHQKQVELQNNNRVLALANERLEALATSDAMTGLPNHRSINAMLDKEVERAGRYGHPFAVLFIDLDHFKALNDGFGHPVGDAALREFTAVVRSALRGPDILGRWGGEEFVALLPETHLEGARGVAERVRSAVARHPFKAAGKAHLTCSGGIAVFPDDATDRDGMIAMADRAMYASKRLGRNQIRIAGEPAVLALWSQDTEAGVRGEGELLATVEALAGLVEARDHCTGEHVDAVAALAVRVAHALGLDPVEAQMIGLAARLHDVGKVAIPDAVLRKPGRLTPEEMALMRTHPAVGAGVVARVPALGPLAPVVRGHHERWDGTGYPDGLVGAEIPLGARIIAVADAYKAMTGDRPYRRGCPPLVAINELRRCAGSQFDPIVVDALEALLAPNPFVAERVIMSESLVD